MSAIGFFGPVGAGKTYMAVRYALNLSASDRKARVIEGYDDDERGKKTVPRYRILPSGAVLDGGPCPRQIVSDTPLNDEQLMALGLPRSQGWSSFDQLVPMQDKIVIGDEVALALDSRKSQDGPMNVAARSKIFLHRKDDFDYVLTFQLPRTLDIIYREFCDLGIWLVEPDISWFNYWHAERERPDKINPRTGRLQVAGDNPHDWWRRCTGFRCTKVDLFEVQRLPREQWTPLDSFRCDWNPEVAAVFNTDHKPVVSTRRLKQPGISPAGNVAQMPF